MKQQLQKKLYVCLLKGMALIVLTISGAMLFSVSANAQIIYTDVNPDSTLYSTNTGLGPGKIYNLDLNNDGINDFKLTATAGNNNNFPTQYHRRAAVSPLNGNAVKDTLANPDTVSIPSQFNAVIDNNLLLNQSWHTSGSNILKDTNYFDPPQFPGSGYGLWNNLSDYYLGLRLLKSGQTYYGWVRLGVDVTVGYVSVIIRDYAYNSIPNQAILAGQTTATGINENSFASSINLFPNPANNQLTIDLPSAKEKVNVTITDITGKVFYSIPITIGTSETEKIKVNTNDFAAGVYVVQIQTADFIGTKKLVIEK